MKRFFLTFLLIVLSLGSCGNDVGGVKKKHRKYSHLEKDIIKQASRKKLPPSELMQVGIKSKSKYKLNPQDESDDDEVGDEQDIANKFIGEDGSYVGEYKIGKEYKISGVTYSPQKYDNFEEVGIASWYGDDFHGKKTANGEIYHKGDMTAAHPTLPLPSMVRITNLGNGKSIIVRVNDRGPFSKKRIVDVSERAAIELGFKDIGTANVKLEFLKEETEEMLTKLGINDDKGKDNNDED